MLLKAWVLKIQPSKIWQRPGACHHLIMLSTALCESVGILRAAMQIRHICTLQYVAISAYQSGVREN